VVSLHPSKTTPKIFEDSIVICIIYTLLYNHCYQMALLAGQAFADMLPV
jgi:hypothetical protein